MNREPMMQVFIECGTFGYALEAEIVLLFSLWQCTTAYGLLLPSPESSDMELLDLSQDSEVWNAYKLGPFSLANISNQTAAM